VRKLIKAVPYDREGGCVYGNYDMDRDEKSMFAERRCSFGIAGNRLKGWICNISKL